MASHPQQQRRFDRRSFVAVSAAAPLACGLVDRLAAAVEQGGQAESPAGPEIIDTNVHLFEWPFRKLI